MFSKRKITVLCIALSLATFAAGCKKKVPKGQAGLPDPVAERPLRVGAQVVDAELQHPAEAGRAAAAAVAVEGLLELGGVREALREGLLDRALQRELGEVRARWTRVTAGMVQRRPSYCVTSRRRRSIRCISSPPRSARRPGDTITSSGGAAIGPICASCAATAKPSVPCGTASAAARASVRSSVSGPTR